MGGKGRQKDRKLIPATKICPEVTDPMHEDQFILIVAAARVQYTTKFSIGKDHVFNSYEF